MGKQAQHKTYLYYIYKTYLHIFISCLFFHNCTPVWIPKANNDIFTPISNIFCSWKLTLTTITPTSFSFFWTIRTISWQTVCPSVHSVKCHRELCWLPDTVAQHWFQFLVSVLAHWYQIWQPQDWELWTVTAPGYWSLPRNLLWTVMVEKEGEFPNDFYDLLT